MKEEYLLKVLMYPHTSEKSTLSAETHRMYVFRVLSSATKDDIKKATELAFKVKVEAVRIVNVKSKPKRFGNIEGRSKNWKKAYITLQPGNQIEFPGVKQ